jgi:hypothetical protein
MDRNESPKPRRNRPGKRKTKAGPRLTVKLEFFRRVVVNGREADMEADEDAGVVRLRDDMTRDEFFYAGLEFGLRVARMTNFPVKLGQSGPSSFTLMPGPPSRGDRPSKVNRRQ